MRSGREFLGTAVGPDRPFADGVPGRIEVLSEKISTTKRICIQTSRELINARSSALSLLAGSINFTPRCNSYVTCDSTPWRLFYSSNFRHGIPALVAGVDWDRGCFCLSPDTEFSPVTFAARRAAGRDLKCRVI